MPNKRHLPSIIEHEGFMLKSIVTSANANSLLRRTDVRSRQANHFASGNQTWRELQSRNSRRWRALCIGPGRSGLLWDSSDLDVEVKQSLENVGAILKSAGMTSADVVSVRVYLVDAAKCQRMNSVYTGYFKDPRPTRTTVVSAIWLGPGMLRSR
jgi:hypothetical protein